MTILTVAIAGRFKCAKCSHEIVVQRTLDPEALAERIVKALTVHAFENDADAEKALRSNHKLLADMLARTVGGE